MIQFGTMILQHQSIQFNFQCNLTSRILRTGNIRHHTCYEFHREDVKNN